MEIEGPEIERVFREEYGRAVAVLIRAFGDIDIAEEAVQDAFTVAAQRWPEHRTASEPGRLDHHDREKSRDRPPPARGLAPEPPRPALLPAGREPVDEGR